jgi:V8-like Glu-specific endopeptidase
MRRLLFLALLFLSCSVPLSGSGALIFGTDRRTTVTTDAGSLFAPVGIVYGAPESEYATAFLLDDCHALTVRHVFGDRGSATGRKIIFAANVDGPPDSWAKTPAWVIAAGHGAARTDDWALLRLRKCLGRTYGHVRLATRLPAPAEPIGIAGYPGDRPLSGGLSIELGCHMRGLRSGAILHDCAALPGSSGGPLFRIIEENDRPVIEAFAMLEAAHSANDLGRNIIEARDNYPDAVWNVAAPLCSAGSPEARTLGCSLRRAPARQAR